MYYNNYLRCKKENKISFVYNENLYNRKIFNNFVIVKYDFMRKYLYYYKY